MTDQISIHTEGLTKHYPDVEALMDLNLDVRAGEVFGFLGPNGAGKTTTIRTILDEIRPTAGRASILGMDTHEQSVEIRRHIGYVPDDLAMYPNLTGRDTLTYFANLRGGVDWSYVDELGDRLGAGPVEEGGRPFLGQPAEGGVDSGLHEPPPGAHHGRAQLRPRPLGATRVPIDAARGRGGGTHRVPLQPHPVRGTADRRPGRDHSP